MLYGIAAILLGLAAVLYGTSALLKVLGVHVKVPERELTEEEKTALRASIEANEAWSKAVGNLVSFGQGFGGDGI